MSVAARLKRRWRFSLRALLLGLTVLCGLLAWLTYQWRWIHDRHDAIAKLHIGTCVSATGITANNVPFDPYLRNLFAKRDAVAPWSLRLLGEPAVFEISVYGPDHAELAARFRRLFPEANVTSDRTPPEPDWIRARRRRDAMTFLHDFARQPETVEPR